MGASLLAIYGLVGMLSCSAAATPPTWRAESPVIEPEPGAAPSGASSTGNLLVETALTGIQQSPIRQRYRYFLYDEKGNYLSENPNDRPSSMALRPGRYIVESRVGFKDKRVQVIIRPGLTTSVSLEDFERSPDSD